MQFLRYTLITMSLLLIFQAVIPVHAQQGYTPTIVKPKEYNNRLLRSEKSGQKKFTVPRRLIQNTVTHYNYYFNANNKLNEVMERAKGSFIDDFSQLIPFYNYSLDVTAADSTQLDSIAYKSQTGIVLHDLRNDWADNMYLLWGAAYYLQKEFDSARMMFQFINYAFADKDKDGSYRVIGSARDGNNSFTISSTEKNSLPRRVFAEPPSRNDAFVWQIRNYLAQDKFAEASTLIQMLKNDPVFPSRLQNDLEEMQALYYYKQQLWDSCASHLEKALGNAANQHEKARWEYLLGQLYETSGKTEDAAGFYSKSINHTTDPIMDVYGRLSLVRINKEGGEHYIDNNIALLVKMAKRDKYVDYRDIIYFMAAQMDLERKNIDGALALLLKSTRYSTSNPSQRNKAFLQLAELSYQKRMYRESYNFYDSLKLDDPSIKDPELILARKNILKKVADDVDIMNRQDSLQRMAALPEDERKSLIKKLTRQIRRQQGLKEEPVIATTGAAGLQPSQPVALFSDNNKKGEWYFYNTTSRQKGLADFKSKWGTRPNTDNWRRSAIMVAVAQSQMQNSQSQYDRQRANSGVVNFSTEGEPEITYEVLYDRLPLTPEKIKQSNDSIQAAQFDVGLLYINELEDCSTGTATLEGLRTRFPDFSKMDEALFKLYFCYNKNGEADKAAAIRKLMTEKYGGSNFTTILVTGKNPQAPGPKEEATRTYEKIYDLFIEGNFTEAIAQKKIADSVFSSNYWTPQLLYIESIYYIRQREDSIAKNVLSNIINRFPGTPLEAKATTMLNVLNRRAQIEEELRNLVITPQEDDTTTRYRANSINNNPPVTAPQIARKDTVVAKPVVTQPIVQVPLKIDTVVNKPVQPPATSYAFNAETPHYVVLALNKVDPVFVNEARNAFARFNRDTYYNKPMQAELVEIDADNRFLLISPFKNAQEAVDYVEKTRPRTASEIIPWLKGGKYTFTIITERNLELLKTTRDIEKYNQFLNQHLPGKF
jgi:tetratricopeptide (TPR) repeat protein